MPFNKGDTDWIRQARDEASLPQTEVVTVPPNAAAGSGYEIAVYRVPATAYNATLSRASFIPNAALGAIGTNLQTVQFRQWRAGVLVGTFAGATTFATSTALVAQAEVVLLSGAAITLQPGDVITLQAVPSGTGAVLPNVTVVVEVSPNVEPN